MGRHKQIENIILQELTTNEERSRRALEIIGRQCEEIAYLEKALKERKNVPIKQTLPVLVASSSSKGPDPSSPRSSPIVTSYQIEGIQTQIQTLLLSFQELKETQDEIRAASQLRDQEELRKIKEESSTLSHMKEEYEFIQEEVHSLWGALKDLKELQKEILTYTSSMSKDKLVEGSEIRKEVQQALESREKVHEEHRSQLESSIGGLTQEIRGISDKLELRHDTDLSTDRKLLLLQEGVVNLRMDRQSINNQLLELFAWKRSVEWTLRDLTAGIEVETESSFNFMNARDTLRDSRDRDSDNLSLMDNVKLVRGARQLWRTARRFFTPEESEFFLNDEEEEGGGVRGSSGGGSSSSGGNSSGATVNLGRRSTNVNVVNSSTLNVPSTA